MSSPPTVVEMLQKLLVEVKFPGQAAWQEIKQLEDNYTKLVSLGRHTGNSLAYNKPSLSPGLKELLTEMFQQQLPPHRPSWS